MSEKTGHENQIYIDSIGPSVGADNAFIVKIQTILSKILHLFFKVRKQ